MRPDGYHRLKTLFARISWADEICLRLRPCGLTVRTHPPELFPQRKNLCRAAALALQREAGVRAGARVLLKKKIPIGAGLGGGSSDAAAVLKGLCRLWKLPLPIPRLARLGARLGSDVCFFLYDTPYAVGTGRGEHILPLRPQKIKTYWIVLLFPRFSLSTREVYGNLRKFQRLPNPNLTAPANLDRLRFHLERGSFLENWVDFLFNRLEDVVVPSYPEIGHIQRSLQKLGASQARLSGSGSCVFGLFSSRSQAIRTARALRSYPWECRIARMG